jgi:hypothetical protein
LLSGKRLLLLLASCQVVLIISFANFNAYPETADSVTRASPVAQVAAAAAAD